jgi:hypothetical protein
MVEPQLGAQGETILSQAKVWENILLTFVFKSTSPPGRDPESKPSALKIEFNLQKLDIDT